MYTIYLLCKDFNKGSMNDGSYTETIPMEIMCEFALDDWHKLWVM